VGMNYGDAVQALNDVNLNASKHEVFSQKPVGQVVAQDPPAGEEVVEGTLTRRGPDRYEGTFRRHTILRFCGSHGTSSEAQCTMTLQGAGAVAAVGDVLADDQSESGRALRLTWTPEPGHSAGTEGACAPAFKDKVKALYLTVTHGVEFDLPAAGAAPRTERPEGYAWTVAIE